MSEGKPEGTNPGPSKEPVQFPVKSSVSPPAETSVDVALSELAFMARQAFQERRRQQCIALTRAMLKIDPEHREARVIQSWVQSDLERELEGAKRLFDEARRNGNRGLYTRAETSVRAILNIDPEMQAAQSFLLEIVSRPQPVTTEENVAIVEEPRFPQPQPGTVFVKPGGRSAWQTAALVVLIVVVGILGGLQLRDRWQVQNSQPQVTASAGTGTLAVTADEGVQVFVNDQLRGVGALMPPLTVAPGTYRLRYMLNGQEISHEEVVVAAGNVTRTTARATNGRLNLTVSPSTGAQIMVDGGPLVPVTPFIDMTPGEHRLYFWAPGYSPELVSATVPAGGEQDISVTLKPLATRPSGSTTSAPNSTVLSAGAT